MRMKKSNKKLAALVGLTLGFYAAHSVTLYDAPLNDGWGISVACAEESGGEGSGGEGSGGEGSGGEGSGGEGSGGEGSGGEGSGGEGSGGEGSGGEGSGGEGSGGEGSGGEGSGGEGSGGEGSGGEGSGGEGSGGEGSGGEGSGGEGSGGEGSGGEGSGGEGSGGEGSGGEGSGGEGSGGEGSGGEGSGGEGSGGEGSGGEGSGGEGSGGEGSGGEGSGGEGSGGEGSGGEGSGGEGSGGEGSGGEGSGGEGSGGEGSGGEGSGGEGSGGEGSGGEGSGGEGSGGEGSGGEGSESGIESAIAAADEVLQSVSEAVGGIVELDAVKVASVDPFKSVLPNANDIAKLLNPSAEQIAEISAARSALLEARAELVAFVNNSRVRISTEEAVQQIAEIDERLDALDLEKQAARITAAVQQAGKTAAAPGVTSARAATAITNVLTNNVVNRTAEIRGFASAVDEGRPAPDKMWFQYKHTNMDVDGGDVYNKSTINTNNFQLGYDTQIGENDYLGAYIGTTTGNADFNGPAQSGRIDIDNSFDFGVYGTHMLPNDQYIDYMIHTGKFDSEYDSSKWGTTDTGAMLGYGAKISQSDRLTLNPYIQLAYDKISVDSYTTRVGNVIKSDDSNNWTAKLGVNLIDASGLYGGVAYSRGLSGSYNAYINGVAMPTNDYNANVLYLSLGYRASMAKNAVLDLSMEKTFMDYKGWTAAGKVNFYF
ncbi:autotransporter domain-containing protein [Veillonellaceae bacterium WCA-693-APC-5D-A]|uniref:Autotransporter domain-containing protein n=1 Tax=Anaerovibrio slackiae TaxID=2652309 RepID=A0A6I2UAT3_9FIRM|nr:autotransporter outer membrane beta-barrel domain-containing protein [Anaerovibrio slackiae]MSU08623.1 autotransporter domain-containing protein [Anaerovibrio slackiae]